MTGPIVCGVDFSEQSLLAAAWARYMATLHGRPLVLVHAIEPLLADAARLTYGPDALRTSVLPDLEAMAEGAEVEVAIGEPASVLHGAALARDASLLVVGTQGLGRAARVWFGSTTMRLLRESTRPILAVPARASATPVCDAIIAGLDFSPAGEAALAAALALGEAAGARVTAMHVVPALPGHVRWNDLVTGTTDVALREARAHLAKMTAAIPESDRFTTLVRTGPAPDVLIDAGHGASTLIVVGIGGSTPTHRPGTTAYRVVSGADAPVLAVPPRA